MTENSKFKRPDCPMADGMRLAACNDPNCGAHIIAFDIEDKPICEIVIPRRHVKAFAFDLLEHFGDALGNA